VRLTGDSFVPKHRLCPEMHIARARRLQDSVADSPPKSKIVGGGCHSVSSEAACGGTVTV